MNPIDYNIDVKQPFESTLQGFQAGVGINGMMQKQQQQELALKQKQQMQIDLDQLAKNPTTQAIAQASLKYPQLSEQFKRSYDMLTPQQQQAKLNAAIPVYAAVQAKRYDIASQQLRDTATAMENSGQAQEAARTRAMADLIEQHPETAALTTGTLLSSIMGPDKFAETFAKLGDQQRAAETQPDNARKTKAEADIKQAEAGVAPEKAVADVANTNSQIMERAARLGIDRDKLTSEMQVKLAELNQKATTLTDDAKKIINDSTTSSVVAGQSAGQMLDLAGRLEKTGAGYGGLSTAAEWMKSATGNQDAMTSMRQEYTRLRNAQALKMLPPGPASDKDIAFAMKGFPGDTADSGSMASFLRGMAKMQQRESVFESAKAEWVNAVGHLGKPKTDIEVDGVKVPAGSTYTDFARQFLKSKTDQRAAEQATQQKTQQLQGRSYMRFAATPGGAAPALGSGMFQPGAQ